MYYVGMYCIITINSIIIVQCTYIDNIYVCTLYIYIMGLDLRTVSKGGDNKGQYNIIYLFILLVW